MKATSSLSVDLTHPSICWMTLCGHLLVFFRLHFSFAHLPLHVHTVSLAFQPVWLLIRVISVRFDSQNFGACWTISQVWSCFGVYPLFMYTAPFYVHSRFLRVPHFHQLKITPTLGITVFVVVRWYMILLFQQNDVVLLEDVAETSSACDGSDSLGSDRFISTVSDVSSFSLESCMHFSWRVCCSANTSNVAQSICSRYLSKVPAVSPSRGGDVTVYVTDVN